MTKDKLVEAYLKAHPKSAALHERAQHLFPGAGATAFVRMIHPFRPYITHALGSRKWDVDGNEYIDYTMGHGALLLGHSHPDVVEAIRDQAGKGVHFGDNHELEMTWAALIREMIPSAERVEFFACGQEANLMAIRLSRIFTGRSKVLRFEENFHGWADEVMLPPSAPGVFSPQVTLIPYDLNRVEAELKTGQYALLMTEGGGAHMNGQIPLDASFVRALPELARRYGTVWLLDEVVSGFRDHAGGFQALTGVKPDLTTLGKIVTGGLGGGALAGRADIMSPLSPESPPEKRVKHSGTWNANPMTCASGIATLRLVKSGEPQKAANEIAAQLRQRGNQMLKDRGFPAKLYGKSISHLYIGPIETESDDDTRPPTRDPQKILGMLQVKERLCLHLLQRGISTLSARLFILSAAHSRKDVDRTVASLENAFDAMIDEGSFPSR